MDDCAEHVPVEEDTKLALEISSTMSEFYESENERITSFRNVMTENDLDVQGSVVYGKYCTMDGDMRTNSFCYCLVKGNNEVGSKGAEPILQAGGYYAQILLERSKQYPYARFPVLMIYVMDARIGFVGALWTTQPNMQVLVNPLALFLHHTDIKNRTIVAQYLGAMKNAIRSLRTYYHRESFPSALDSTDQPDFPYQRTYTSLLDGTPYTFTYKAQLTNKPVFVAEANDGGGELCIKFVHRYSKEAHLKCAELGFAPSLRGFENLPGGWTMVVMDQIDNNFRGFRECKPTTTLYERLKRDITNLHQANLVHPWAMYAM